jgi:hypothetical protein
VAKQKWSTVYMLFIVGGAGIVAADTVRARETATTTRRSGVRQTCFPSPSMPHTRTLDIAIKITTHLIPWRIKATEWLINRLQGPSPPDPAEPSLKPQQPQQRQQRRA